RLEPVPLAVARDYRRVDVYSGDRHQAHDPRRRCAHRVERRHGDCHARPAAAGRGRRAHAEVVRQGSGRDGEMMARVSLRDVKKTYGVLQVVHGVSIDVADGEFVVIVGPSGCGKSTLLRMVAGLETISSGAIAIGGRVVNELEPKDRVSAMVVQIDALYPHMSV